MEHVTRRTALRLGAPVALSLVGVHPASASLDGKGNDVCPCFFGIDEATLDGDERITVSGHCAVQRPPEDVTVHVRVRGDRGARAIGSAAFACEGTDDAPDSFSVGATIRGVNRFEWNDAVHVRATAHIFPGDEPAIAGRWDWDGTLG